MHTLTNIFSEQEKAQLTKLLKQAGASNRAKAMVAQDEIAAALEVPIRQAFLTGSTIEDIFEVEEFEPGADTVYPLDLYHDGDISDFRAYTVPAEGRIPERMIYGDELRVQTYDVANSIDFLRKFARNARFDVIARALEILEAGFTMKANDDAWHLIMRAGLSRGYVVNDPNAADGQFTRYLLSLMQLNMRRLSTGNAGNRRGGTLTRLYISPEAAADMASWDDAEVPETIRERIANVRPGDPIELGGTQLVVLDELGEGQPYTEWYKDVLAAELGASNDGLAEVGDVEIVIGVDTNVRDSFVMPIKQPLEIFRDDLPGNNLHRQRRMGFYGETEYGLAALNNSRVLIGSF